MNTIDRILNTICLGERFSYRVNKRFKARKNCQIPGSPAKPVKRKPLELSPVQYQKIPNI